MLLSERSKKVMEQLVSNPNITSKALEKKFQLSRRQLGYCMNKINEWLMTNNLPVIERTRQGHFIIDQAVFTNLQIDQVGNPLDTTFLTEEQRVQLIIMYLLGSEEELSLNHFTIELGVSKNTILHDLKHAQTFLDDYDLYIRYSRKKGYLIEGREFQVRKLLINVTYHILQMRNGKSHITKLTGIENKLVDEFHKRIEKVENKLNLKFTDDKLVTMPYILILILRRIERGNEINPFSIKYEELSNTKEYQATEEILYDVKGISVTERLFITLQLLTTNVYSSECMPEETIPDLIPAIDQMLRLFEKSACIYIQERDLLLDKLLQHITPAYYRIKYQLNDTINFQGALSKEFKEIHHLIKRSTEPLSKLIGAPIPENETAYLTMLVGGWMKKQGDSIEKKVKAIVVCPQGVSVSKLMFNELRELFPEFVFLDSLSIREFRNYELDVDIVFSPTMIETDKKLFIAKVFLGQEDKYRLRKQVMLDIHGYIPKDINVNQLLGIIKNHSTIHNDKALTDELERYLNRDENAAITRVNSLSRDMNLDELITREHITLRNSVDSWEEAIRISAMPLVKKGSINETFVNAMIRRSMEDSYIVIGSNIAIPHAAPEDGANEVGMSLLRLRKGVRYGENYTIHLIIVIAAVDKQQHIHALMQLMKLAGSEADCNKMINSNSIKDIHHVIASYSTD